MPQDHSSYADLADRALDHYRDAHGTTSHLHRSAAWDASLLTLALLQVRLAKDAVAGLSQSGDLAITRVLGTGGSDALPSLQTAEEEMERVLNALRQL